MLAAMGLAVKALDVGKVFTDVRALEGISFEVGEGELFGFIGPDGAGKTTLFRILTTLLLADSGSAEVLGMDVVRDYRKIRREVGYMPGRFSLYQDLSVKENLDFFATVFGTRLEDNYELIRDIYSQIEPFKDRLAGKLSGGMKQKLALSCALVHKPGILVLDEPTTGVDAVSRKEFWEMLARLRDDGLTILVSTPYMDEASRCDRVALMQQGKILTINSPAGIAAGYPWQLFSIRAGDMYRLKETLEGIPGRVSVFRFGQDIHLALKPEHGSTSEIEIWLLKNGHDDASIRPASAGIEDCFMDLMIQ